MGSSSTTPPPNRKIKSNGRRADVTSFLVTPDSNISPELSVVMPTLDEEDGIETCMNWIKSAIEELQIPTEVLVSDSSSDRTPQIAREMGAKVVEPDDRGYGCAYRHGFEQARGEYIVMGDADTTYDFRQIPQLLNHLQETNAGMVIGSRLEGEITDGAMPLLHQYIGNPLLTSFLNTFYGAGVSDAHSGFRIFTRDVYESMNLETTGMEFASEMVMEASARGVEIVEVPITYHEREGEETLDSFRDGWRHVRFMLLNAPGYLYSGPGVLLLATGIVIATAAYASVSFGPVSLGPNSMIAGSLLTILGIQVGSIGIFASVVTNPVRELSDPVTSLILEHVTLERGAAGGLLLFFAGVAHALLLVVNWISTGFSTIPVTSTSLAASTAIVVGFQVIFSSFFLSSIN